MLNNEVGLALLTAPSSNLLRRPRERSVIVFLWHIGPVCFQYQVYLFVRDCRKKCASDLFKSREVVSVPPSLFLLIFVGLDIAALLHIRLVIVESGIFEHFEILIIVSTNRIAYKAV